MKHKDFGDHELHCIRKWVILIREGSEAYIFEYIEWKWGGVESNAPETRIHATS